MHVSDRVLEFLDDTLKPLDPFMKRLFVFGIHCIPPPDCSTRLPEIFLHHIKFHIRLVPFWRLSRIARDNLETVPPCAVRPEVPVLLLRFPGRIPLKDRT